MRLLMLAFALVPAAPRPEPILSAYERGYAVEVFELPGTPAQALQSYARGKRVHAIHGALAVGRSEIVHAFKRGERTLLARVRMGDEEQARVR